MLCVNCIQKFFSNHFLAFFCSSIISFSYLLKKALKIEDDRKEKATTVFTCLFSHTLLLYEAQQLIRLVAMLTTVKHQRGIPPISKTVETFSSLSKNIGSVQWRSEKF